MSFKLKAWCSVVLLAIGVIGIIYLHRLVSKTTVQAVSNRVLMAERFNTDDRLVTNEYVHWNPESSCPYKSPVWDMTSGSLMVKDGAAYSGIPTAESTIQCESSNKNNSAIFRLNTKDQNYGNVTVSLDYKVVRHGGGGAGTNVYDGLHVWVGYKDEYSLYIATIFRWDKNLVTKKKIPTTQAQCGEVSNGGCYYNISPEKQFSVSTIDTWHHADIVYKKLDYNTVIIKTYIDHNLLVSAKDQRLHGSIYPTGAVGIRGDNTEFYFKNFIVTSL